MFENVDWSQRGDYMSEKHGVTVAQANEALQDPERVVINPDYNSQSGRSVRIIGYSLDFGDLLSILVVEHEQVEYGINGWRSNEKDRRIYLEEEGW